MYFDRFDICEAYYIYFTQYHSGQFSAEYSRLSNLLSFFTPSDSLSSEDDLSDNGREIYEGLVTTEPQFTHKMPLTPNNRSK